MGRKEKITLVIILWVLRKDIRFWVEEKEKWRLEKKDPIVDKRGKQEQDTEEEEREPQKTKGKPSSLDEQKKTEKITSKEYRHGQQENPKRHLNISAEWSPRRKPVK